MEKVKKNNDLLRIAKNLRHNMTRQERHLWYDFLRGYPVKIYKQRIIENYVVDFYCSQVRVAIEIDGSQHYCEEGARKDNTRTKVLEKYDILVLRFSNRDVDDRFEGVCGYSDETITNKLNETPLTR